MFSKDKLNLPNIEFFIFSFSRFFRIFLFNFQIFKFSSLKDIFKLNLKIISRSQIYCQPSFMLDLSDGTFTVRYKYGHSERLIQFWSSQT